MKDLKYLIETEYVDQNKWQEDSKKGWAVYQKLNDKYLPEFKKILYYENQFEFWEKKLGVNYFYYHLEYLDGLVLINLHNFDLYAPESDWIELNEWLIKNAAEYISSRLIGVGNDVYQINKLKAKVVSFATLKSDFELRFSETSNTTDIIQNELLDFDKNKSLYMSQASIEVFDKYMNYGVIPDYTRIPPDIHYLLKIHNGYQYALYREYLQNELARSRKKGNPSLPTSAKSEPLTNAQIALLLHYTGVIQALQDVQFDNTVIARIISSITGGGFKGIYDPIGKVHTSSLKTKKNLLAVLKRLKEADLEEFTKDVDWDYKTAKS